MYQVRHVRNGWAICTRTGAPIAVYSLRSTAHRMAAWLNDTRRP